MSLPSFMIIGASRSGSTSMYRYLQHHPQITPPRAKEPCYFNLMYHKPWNWYLSFFPHCFPPGKNGKQITFDATPSYMSDPNVPRRIREDLGSDLKFIAVLRNPIDRAWSHYCHHFQDKVTAEFTFEQSLAFPPDPFYNFIDRGMYFKHLVNWFKTFNKENFLILDYYDFVHDTARVMNTVHRFVGIDQHIYEKYPVWNKSNPRDRVMSKEVRVVLEEIYEKPNELLFDLLGHTFKF